jgi:hypothetical protein
MIENITMRYAMNAKLMKMNHTTSQNDIAGILSRGTDRVRLLRVSPSTGGGSSSPVDDLSRRKALKSAGIGVAGSVSVVGRGRGQHRPVRVIR